MDCGGGLPLDLALDASFDADCFRQLDDPTPPGPPSK